MRAEHLMVCAGWKAALEENEISLYPYNSSLAASALLELKSLVRKASVAECPILAQHISLNPANLSYSSKFAVAANLYNAFSPYCWEFSLLPYNSITLLLPAQHGQYLAWSQEYGSLFTYIHILRWYCLAMTSQDCWDIVRKTQHVMICLKQRRQTLLKYPNFAKIAILVVLMETVSKVICLVTERSKFKIIAQVLSDPLGITADWASGKHPCDFSKVNFSKLYGVTPHSLACFVLKSRAPGMPGAFWRFSSFHQLQALIVVRLGWWFLV